VGLKQFKMKQTKIILGAVLIAAITFFSGCNKEFDSPPIATLPEGNIITIDSLRNIYTFFDSTFVDDFSVYGVISADEVSGNLYKNLYLQDGTNGILLKLTSSSSNTFFMGDSVRVSLKGSTIAMYKNMIQLDNVDPEINLIKQGDGSQVQPKIVTISELAITGIYTPYQAQLIQLNDVEFICSEVCNTYGDPINQSNQNRTLTDTLGNTIIVRTSGFSSFAGTNLQQGKGSFIALVTQFNSTVQLTMRQLGDLSLTGTRKTTCASCPFYAKNWEDNSITSGGWSTQNVVGATSWETGNIGGLYAQISNYDGSSNSASESWYVSPAFNLTATTNPVLAFRNAWKYTGSPLQLMVTTNYTGDVTTTTWTDITSSATWSLGNFAWTSSGNINLSAYQQAGVRFAFKYVGGATNGSTWEIDDFTLTDI
jgi:hypothetical protein